MIAVSPELLASMRMLPRLLVIAAVSAAFVLPAASFVRKAEQAVKKSDDGATLSPAQKLLQPVQLAAAVGLLVELPCYACGRPALGWRLSLEYYTFFAFVTLPRAYRIGRSFQRPRDRGGTNGLESFRAGTQNAPRSRRKAPAVASLGNSC